MGMNFDFGVSLLLLVSILAVYGRAMHSISTSTPLGSCLTATQLRAGLCVNHSAYSRFICCETVSRPAKSGEERVPYLEVGHVGQEDIDLDDLLDRRAGLGQNRLEVPDTSSRLLAGCAVDDLAILVTRNLARAVYGRRRLDGLGLPLTVRALPKAARDIKELT